ncbi:MAG: hypothetical protein AB7I48_03095 [Planctomycetaceae bacterium]
MIEVRIPIDVYQRRYRKFEHVVPIGRKVGVELAIPASQLDEMNQVGVRSRIEEKAQ